MSFDGVLYLIQSNITLPDFLSVSVAANSFVNYEIIISLITIEVFSKQSDRG